jgi:hypothetical protein
MPKVKDEYELWQWRLSIAIVALALLIAISWVCSILLDFWWFESLGLEEVYLTNLKAMWTLFGIGFILALLILGVFKRVLRRNLRIKEIEGEKREVELRLNELLAKPMLSFQEEEQRRSLERELHYLKAKVREYKGILVFCAFIHFFIALVIGWLASLSWFDWLKFLNQTPFGISDPVFGKDLSFYFFTLPFLQGILTTALIFLLILIGWQALVSLFVFGELEWRAISQRFWRGSFSALALLGAVQFWLLQYSILYSEFGVVYGAGWTDLHVFLPMYQLLSGIFVLLALACFFPPRVLKGLKEGSQPILVFGVPLALLLSFWVVAFVVQSFMVAPNELAYEKPYLEQNIKFTRYGFDLEKIKEKEYRGKAALDLSVLNSSTIENIRILDWPPALTALSQKQELRIYYDFPGIDIDRYELNGKKTQVLLTLREINLNKLPAQAQTWVNQRLVFTHGYGMVVSPVNRIDREGMPVMLVKDIPPVSESLELEIKEPRIYYGELTSDYIITNTLQKEFDYPIGDQNVFTEYQGNGGILIDSSFKRIVAAICLDPINIWFSEYITKQSRLHLYRNVEERVEKIAPFLLWDGDPYIYLENGRPQWMLMGVVGDERMPYSEPSYWKTKVVVEEVLGELRPTLKKEGKVNYVRDAIKGIVDPVNGTVAFYVIQRDPLVETYTKIYPVLFKDGKELSENTRKHFKYPGDLFTLQIRKFNVYHMADPTAFYNKEDQWVTAEEKYHGVTKRIEAYNVLIEIDGKTEFILMQPVTPKGKQNMIAWLAVFQDPERYGEIICYRFPKGELVYGPIQIEARVDQDPELSKLITLWGQVGSEVFRGNLLVIPVNESLLYIEPLYLSSEVSPIPELRKVIAVWHDPIAKEDRVAFGDTTKEAITKVLVGKIEKPAKPEKPEVPKEKEIIEILEEIERLIQELRKRLS